MIRRAILASSSIAKSVSALPSGSFLNSTSKLAVVRRKIPCRTFASEPDGKIVAPEPTPSAVNEDHLLLIEELKKENETLVESVKNLEDKYKRSIAETENVRHRLQRQIEEAKLFSVSSFCKDLLEIADVLQLAKDSVPKEALSGGKADVLVELKQLHEGIVLTDVQLLKIFAKHGLVRVDPLGEKFNPNVHEALFELVDESKQAGTVGVVVKVGYVLHERTLRPAKVGIVKKAS